VFKKCQRSVSEKQVMNVRFPQSRHIFQTVLWPRWRGGRVLIRSKDFRKQRRKSLTLYCTQLWVRRYITPDRPNDQGPDWEAPPTRLGEHGDQVCEETHLIVISSSGREKKGKEGRNKTGGEEWRLLCLKKVKAVSRLAAEMDSVRNRESARLNYAFSSFLFI